LFWPLFRVVLTKRHNLPATLLVVIAIVGQMIGFGLGVLIARQLSITGFESYVVASAIFVLASAIAPLGAEKLTLRQWPGLVRLGQWPLARGLFDFGVRRTLATAMIVAACVALVSASRSSAEMRTAILVTCLALPGGALVHYGVDLLTAAGRPFRAMAIFRLAVPATALCVFVAALALGVRPEGWVAVGAWGLAWLAALALMVRAVRPRIDPRLLAAAPQSEPGRWNREARPFLVHAMVRALLAQSAVLALELLGADGIDVGAFAAAMAIVSLAAVLATATNRAYGRDLALLVEAKDFAGIAVLHRRRLRWMLPLLAGFVLIALAFPASLLALFRPEFADAGTAPLRLMAIATACTVAFSLAPTLLKFQRRNRAVYTVMAIGAGLQILLLGLLVPRFGATGAALAYAVTMIGVYSVLALLASEPFQDKREG
jgi:O-antigen/teichoic acid export membrane protein